MLLSNMAKALDAVSSSSPSLLLDTFNAKYAMLLRCMLALSFPHNLRQIINYCLVKS